jgi:hypothetical protein
MSFDVRHTCLEIFPSASAYYAVLGDGRRRKRDRLSIIQS